MATQDLHVTQNTMTSTDCTCYYSCGEDSHSGHWHQHEDNPCPVHPDSPMVG